MTIDTSDELRSRPQKSSLGTVFNSERNPSKMTEVYREETDQFVEQTGNPGPTVCKLDEESRSRQARCSLSTDQQIQQPVTPVVQNGSIDTTVVNNQDVDKCWVTNKHTNVKQDAISMSNQWLSSAFSKITFGVWGKSKTGEEFTENVHAYNKSMLTSMPEFNFPL